MRPDKDLIKPRGRPSPPQRSPQGSTFSQAAGIPAAVPDLFPQNYKTILPDPEKDNLDPEKDIPDLQIMDPDLEKHIIRYSNRAIIALKAHFRPLCHYPYNNTLKP